jgi:GNAT superfamily N-acetyltransferase
VEHNIVFREIRSGEEESVYEIVIDCFNQFIAPGYSCEGIREFENYVKAGFLRERLKNRSYSFIALDKDEIVGVIEVRNISHISLLFVKQEYQNMGIAKKLVGLSLNKSKKVDHSINVIEVNSSPYAVKIYEHMGFIQVDVEQVVNGIRFVPMNLTLN